MTQANYSKGNKQSVLLILSCLCILALLVVACVTVTYMSDRKQVNIAITPVHHKAKVESALDLAYMTTRFAIIEGGSYGGLLNDISKDDLHTDAPEISNYSPKTDSIIWFYQFEPTSIKLVRNWIDGVSVEVSGTKKKDGNIYIAKINTKLKAIPYRILCKEATANTQVADDPDGSKYK